MMTKEYVTQMVLETIEEAKSVGIPVQTIEPVVEFPKVASYYGACKYTKATGTYCIRISLYVLNAQEEDVRNTVMHEVLHATGAKGHGALWKSYAAKVNNAFGYNITRCSEYKDFDMEDYKPSKSRDKDKNPNAHMVKCVKCGHEFKRAKKSKLIQHPDCYLCKCGGNLELVY